MNLLKSVSIAQPLMLLLAIPLLALLWYVYRRRGKGRRVLVASTFLLKKLESQSNTRQTFVPPLRFFFELLLFCTILAMLAGVSFQTDTRKTVLLLDNSFHTFARVSDTTRFARIKDTAQSLLAGVGTDGNIAIYTSNPELQRVYSSSENGSLLSKEGDLWEQVHSLTPAYGSVSLETALSEVLRQEKDFSTLYVISDRPTRKEKQDDGKIRYFSISQSAQIHNNIAIKSVKRSGKKDAAVEVTLASFSTEDSTAVLNLTCSTSSDPSLAETSASDRVELPPQSEARVALPLPTVTTPFCKIALEDIEPPHSDAIVEDNIHWFLPDQDEKFIAVVSAFSLKELQLDLLDTYAFRHYTPKLYEQKHSAQEENRSIIFHRYLPKQFPTANALFVTPEETPSFLKSARRTSINITRWDTAHPLTRYLDFDTLRVTGAQSFFPSLDFSPIVSATQGAAILASQKQGKRYVVSGIELFPYTASENPVASILLLNTLKWLQKEDLSAAQNHEWHSEAASNGIHYLHSADEEKTAKIRSIAEAKIPGIIQLQNAEEKVLPIAFFDTQQSNLLNLQPLKSLNVPHTEESAEQASRYYHILLLLFIVLIVDALVMLYRQRSAI